MEALIVLAVTFVLLWVFFILPQQRRVRAHQHLVAGLREGDEVVLTAGIYGRIRRLGAEEMTLEVAPGVEVRVARQAVLRRADADTAAEAPAPTADLPAEAADVPAPAADVPAPAGERDADPATSDADDGGRSDVAHRVHGDEARPVHHNPAGGAVSRPTDES